MQVSGNLKFLIFFSGLAALAGDYHPCPRFTLQGGGLSFSTTERKLICGDSTREGWKNIPLSQAIFHLKTFLQQRGFHHPTFEQKGDSVLVQVGAPTRVTSLFVRNAPFGIRPERIRKIRGEILTPAFLDSLGKRIQHLLQVGGYACVDLDLSANPDTGEVVASLKPGRFGEIAEIRRESVEGLHTEALSRYDAMDVGQNFNADSLQLTSTRIQDAGVLQSSHFVVDCTDEGVSLTQKSIAGPPRTVVFGIGADTEKGLRGMAAWRHQRLGGMASRVDLSALLSFSEQQIKGLTEWYLVPSNPRFYLQPELTLRRKWYSPEETLTLETKIIPRSSWEFEAWRLSAGLGPTFVGEKNLTWNPAGNAVLLEQRQTLGTLDAEIKGMSHDFELYRSSPRSGWAATLLVRHANQAVFSPATASLVSASFQALWNLGQFDPPLFVLGLKGAAATNVTSEAWNSVRVPKSFRQRLGGIQDLRGFTTQELGDLRLDPNSDPVGGLSSMYFGIDLRLVETLPFGLQPFIFSDLGWIGRQPLFGDLAVSNPGFGALQDPPVYYDAGVGMRWESSFGSFQATVARGFLSQGVHSLSHFTFHFSFGDQF